jgi:hypothetical protein
MLNNFNIRAFLGTSDVQAVFSFEKALPEFDRYVPAKCSVFPFLFGAEHYQSLEIALTNVGQHYLKLDVFHIESCKDVPF